MMVLDHFGTPIGVGRYAEQRDEIFEEWKRDIADIAGCENVVAKLGGLAMPDNGFGWHTPSARRRPTSSSPRRAAITSTRSSASAPTAACSSRTSRSTGCRSRTACSGTAQEDPPSAPPPSASRSSPDRNTRLPPRLTTCPLLALRRPGPARAPLAVHGSTPAPPPIRSAPPASRYSAGYPPPHARSCYRAAVTSSLKTAILVERNALRTEPAAHVPKIPVEEVECLRVRRDVDGLRDVDDPQPAVPPQQVEGGQVGVHEPGAHHRRRLSISCLSSRSSRPGPNQACARTRRGAAMSGRR